MAPLLPKPVVEVEKETKPEIEIVSATTPEIVLKENGRPRFSINLQNAFMSTVKTNEKPKEQEAGPSVPDEPVTIEKLKHVWDLYTQLRKEHIAEYQLLQREFEFKDSTITVVLSNPIEEPLLQDLKAHLIPWLQEQLSNRSIDVKGRFQEVDRKKAIYTNKEKFDHLADKNPILLELRDRLGLDADY